MIWRTLQLDMMLPGKSFPLFFLLAFLMCAAVCNQGPAANGEGRDAPALNLFTEILQFPDRGASKHTDPVKDQTSREPVKFAERYGRIFEERVAKMGGRPPLEGPGKLKFEKEMMLVQAGLLFDMRLEPGHPAKKKFLDIVAWTFDRRQPILEKGGLTSWRRRRLLKKPRSSISNCMKSSWWW